MRPARHASSPRRSSRSRPSTSTLATRTVPVARASAWRRRRDTSGTSFRASSTVTQSPGGIVFMLVLYATRINFGNLSGMSDTKPFAERIVCVEASDTGHQRETTMKPMTNSEIARRNAATTATYATRTPGYRTPPVLHETRYTGGYAIHYTGRVEDRGEDTPAHAVNSAGQILTSDTYAGCERFLAAMGCRRMS